MANEINTAAQNAAQNAANAATQTEEGATTAAQNAANSNETTNVFDHSVINDGGIKAIIAEVVNRKDADGNKPNKLHKNVRLNTVVLNEHSSVDAKDWFFTLTLLNGEVDGTDSVGTPIRTRSIVTSIYALLGTLKKEFDEVAMMNGWLLEHPKHLTNILVKCTCDFAQEYVPANEEYVNPFASRPVPTRFSSAHIFSYPYNFRLSPLGKKMLEKAVDAYCAEL